MKAALQGHLRRLPHVDGVMLDLHGAMGVSGRGAVGDAEAELPEAAREACVTICGSLPTYQATM
jgi:microcystin degradation protein MlrC